MKTVVHFLKCSVIKHSVCLKPSQTDQYANHVPLQVICSTTFYYSMRRSVAVTHEACCNVLLSVNGYLWYMQIFKTAVGWQ